MPVLSLQYGVPVMRNRVVVLVVLLILQMLFISGCPEESTTTALTPQEKSYSTLRYPFDIAKKWSITQEFYNYYDVYKGYHPAEDWSCALGDGDTGEPIFAIAPGIVVDQGPTYQGDSDGAKAGFYLIIRHTGIFKIPSKSGSAYSYEDSDVKTIYSAYMHVNPESWVNINTEITTEMLNKPIAKLSGGMTAFNKPSAHLHFEIRISDDNKEPLGSVLISGTNGYLSTAREIVDLGYRKPSSIIEANGGQAISNGQVLETETSAPTTVTTATIPETSATTAEATTSDLVNEESYGFIEKIYNDKDKYYLTIDYVNYLFGNAAVKAMKEDGVWDRDYNETYVEYVFKDGVWVEVEMNLTDLEYFEYTHPNDSGYIQNNNPKIRTFEIASNAYLGILFE